MTREGLTPGGEILLTPEYWDGHSFQDSCEWFDAENLVPGRVNIHDFLDTLRKERRKGGKLLEAERKTFATMRSFYELSKGGSEAVGLARFARRETFDPATQRSGTVIRENAEMASVERGGRIRTSSSTIYGVVCELEGEERPQKWIAYYIFGLEEPWLWRVSNELIEIGLVDHHRTRDFLHFDWESLHRVTSVEIMLPGTGQSAQVNSPQTGLTSLQLNPQPTA